MADSKNNTIKIVFEGDSKKLEASLKRIEKGLKTTATKTKPVNTAMSGMLATAKKLVPAIGAAFAVREIAMFAKEAVMLGAQLDGISQAFRIIENTGKTSMGKLQEATRGAVSEITLMSLAVQANNFKVPLENLAGFFEFATIRAAQTGESVEHLTRSIVTGIGRKSPLILDNLGITLVRLKEAMGKVGRESATVADISAAVAKIAKEETEFINALGLAATTTAQKLSKLGAGYENFKAGLGKDISESNIFDKIMDGVGSEQDLSALKRKIGNLSEAMGLSPMEVRAMSGLHKAQRQGSTGEQIDDQSMVLSNLLKQSEALFKASRAQVLLEVNPKGFEDIESWQVAIIDRFKEMTASGKAVAFPFFAEAIEEEHRILREAKNTEDRATKDSIEKREAFTDKYIDGLKKIAFEETTFTKTTREAMEARIALNKSTLVSGIGDSNLSLSSGYKMATASVKLFANALGFYDLEAYNASKTTEDKAEAVGRLNEQYKRAYGSLTKLLIGQQNYDEGAAVSEATQTINETGYGGLGEEEGEEPEYYIKAKEREEGREKELTQLRELSTMYNTLASAMGSLASNFNPDSSIAKFLKLAQGAAVAAGAIAALQMAITSGGNPVAIIATGAAVVAALLGTVAGISSGGGGGGGYNASSSSSGGRLYTEISGQNLRVVLDRADGFNSRRG